MHSYIKALAVFNNMVQRCYDENHKAYKNYGGRGIVISHEWLNDISKFVRWYTSKYFDKCQVDRIDNNGPYSETNCRLVSSLENNRNRRNTRFLTAWGITKTYGEWTEDARSGKRLTVDVIDGRLKNRNLTPEQVVSLDVSEIKGQQYYTPKYSFDGKNQTLLEWSKEAICIVKYKTLHCRVHRGWPLEKALKTPSRKIKNVL